jgi:uncharacterized protein YlxW (UPF0749 family)
MESGRRFGVRSQHNLLEHSLLDGDVMKRISVFMLLIVLSVGGVIPAQAQRISREENARQSRRAGKKQQKMLNKANKKQRKAAKKYEKQQRKATRRANRRNKK